MSNNEQKAQYAASRTGRVVRNTGAAYIVEDDADGTLTECRAKGNFRLKGIRTTNPVAVGDCVTYANGFITAITPRRNYIIRRASNLSKESHILAANLDLAVLVMTLRHPQTSLNFVDRFLATAEAYGIPALIVINKIDLLDDEYAQADLAAVTEVYRSIGYEVMHVSATTGEGMDALRDRLKGQTALFSGNSGVGKSTLINDMVPGADIRTAAISDAHDQGMHTTTFSELHHLPDREGSIIDTPGVRGFGTIDFTRSEAAHYFPEMFAAASDCRFGAGCTHTHEPGCAVRRAVSEGRIAPSRYNSYLSILDDTAEGKYRAAP